YRTGDLARHAPGGEVEYLGRLDHQVKIRGFRIELGEIEACLAAHPAVREAAVLARTDAGTASAAALVAYVVAAGAQPSTAELADSLRARLPDYMVPSAWVFLPALPLNPNGKLDRRALPAPERAGGEAAHVAPRTPEEEILAGLWAQLLDLPRVGVFDNFFELGGHSLLGARLVARVRQTLGVELPLRDLFEAPTVAGLVARIHALRTPEAFAEPPILSTGVTEAPLSFAQERLWFLDRLQPGGSLYNIPAVLRLTGDLDVEALRRSFAELVRRHGTLRTAFAEIDGRPWQVVAPPTPIPLPIVDLSGLAAQGFDRHDLEATRQIAEEVDRPFDLALGPILRLLLLRHGRRDHTLIVVVHHIASDGWSMGVLVRETTVLYEAFLQGLPSPLPELPIQYTDFSMWQRQWALDAQLDFWRRELAGAPALLELPTDRPRPAVQSSRGATFAFSLPTVTAGVHTFARRAGATPFMVLLAAFQTFLYRSAEADDVLVGSTVANRNRVEVEGLIGFFVNTLVFRLRLREGESFLALLERVRAAMLAGHDHQDLPFELLVDALGVERSLAYNPLFQVLLELQNFPSEELRAPGLTFTPVEAPITTAKFDLTLTFLEVAEGLAGMFEYALDLFDPPTIGRFAGHYRTLLEAALADPGLAVDRLPLMSSAERHQVLLAWNDTAVALDLDQPFAALFAAQVARRPKAPAVISGPVTLTYAELDHRADRLGRSLRALGAGPEILVALLDDRGIDLLAAILAVFKVGAAYLPLDAGHPAPRLRQVLRQSGARIVLTGERHRPVLEAALESMEAPPIVEPIAGPAAADGEDLASLRPLPDSLAYVIFTSGSTGLPKGAMVSQRGMVNHLWAKIRDLDIGPDDTVAQTASQCFDISVWQHLAALAVGGRVRIYPDDVAHDPPVLLARAAEERVTVLQTVPSLLREMLEDIERGDRRAPDLSALRWLVPTGEALAPDLWARWLRRYPAIPLVNAYGPTECSDDVTHALLAAPAPDESSVRVPVGRPVVNTRLYLVDRGFRAVPPGVAGELCVGGAGVGRGYLDDPERTALVFVPDPFSGEPGARLYRTGDLTRRRSDGAVEFLGRIDHQVKVRGYRIELGEIEASLCRHPAVRDAVVLAREDRPGQKRLAAYVVPRDRGAEQGEAELSPAALRAFLAERLPEYMVPADWMVLEALPLTPNGKVDRKALPALARDDHRVQEAPRTAAEIRLAEIWAELLGIEAPGREESFFELGGHSLLATRLLSRVRETFRIELPLRAVFEAPTVAGLAERIDALGTAGPLEEPPLLPTGATEAPLSFAQERLWFLDRLQPDSTAYNLPTVLRLTGDLDIGALRRSFTEIVRRHAALRTTFVEIDGEPRQVIAPPGPVSLPVIDLSGLPAQGSDQLHPEAGRLTAQEADHPFDLARGPLLRLHLLRHGHRRHTLIVNVHHVVSDGWSAGVLVQETTSLYDAFVQGLPSPLPELPVQYVDFAIWQRRWLSGPVLEAQLDFWRRELTGAPALLELPTDRPRPSVQSSRGATIAFTLPAEAVAAAQLLAGQAGATPFMVFLAAFQTLLHRWSGADDVLVGSPIANRNRVEIEELIGFFVNTLVYRLRIHPEKGFLATLKRVRETTIASHDHQDLPFELLVEKLGVERSLAHTPLFQVMVVLQNAPTGELQAPGLTFAPADAPNTTAKLDLMLALYEIAEGFAGEIEYATDLFDGATVRRFLGHFANLIAGAAAAPDRRLAELPLLSEAERHQVTVEWTASRREHEEGASLDRLFAQQAARTPSAIAVSSPEESLSYAELDRRSDLLAERLAALGVGPEVPVALLLPRSAALAVAILGVLKAGGAYVPLDPAYPAERLRLTALDCQAPVVVTVREVADRLPPIPATVIDVDEASRRASGRRSWRSGRALSRNAAYVIYTSGSTGIPKGVVVEHRQVVRLFETTREAYGFGPEDVWTLFHSYAFDFSVWEIWGALLYGGRLVVVPYEVSRSPEDFYRLLCRERVTVLNQTPSAFGQLIRAEEESGADPTLALRWVIFGGEALAPRSLAGFAARHPAAPRLVNMYGITETTVHVTIRPLESADFAAGRSPIGRTIPDLEAWVLGPGGAPAPIGVPGELCVGGAGLARGYLGRPELTAARFVPCPFAELPGDRLYRSGDLVRLLPDGELEYLGRIDHQVKIRGFRIELGEIQAVLDRHPGVRESRVLVRDEDGDRRLVAWFVPASEALEAAELRDHLRDHLPEHMVPAAFVAVPEWPLTPNGKVDLKALPAPERRGDAGVQEQPRTPTEARLAEIWAKLLGVAAPGREESFFELGGHSLLATRLVSRVRESLRVALPLRVIFEAPTIADLAARIDALRAPEPSTEIPLLPTGKTEAPLSFAQERLWFLDRLQPDSAFYNIPAVLRLTGDLDLEALRHSFTEVVRRHTSLRTTFIEIGGAPRQVVLPAGPVALPVVDLSGLPALHREQETARQVAREVNQPFDLARGPLLRLRLLRQERRDHVLIANVHHIASDGWSMGVLVRETTALYEAFVQGLPSPLP
ncbi:MAG TPA: amino acid adenylation domain-containing protein, partial [Thermoanaerobaculia bacterium]